MLPVSRRDQDREGGGEGITFSGFFAYKTLKKSEQIFIFNTIYISSVI